MACPAPESWFKSIDSLQQQKGGETANRRHTEAGREVEADDEQGMLFS